MDNSNQNLEPLKLACRSEATVLITGPTGSGKSFLAKRIHESGPRKNRSFTVVNLASLHEGTFESELFGHERGAFTGAESRRIGRLESANGGTLFLDEVGELPLRLQARLLEFLQSRTISPVGSSREVRLDVRIIAATNKNLEKSVSKAEFRQDLFHRLRVLSLDLKPISERPDEFDEILHATLEDLCRQAGRTVLRISEEVAESLENHDWPGNIRELRNVLEYAVLASTGPEIRAQDLPVWFTEPPGRLALRDARLGVAEITMPLDYQGAISGFERQYLDRALRRYRGRINQTARAIGINKTTLIRRLRAYGLNSTENSENREVEMGMHLNGGAPPQRENESICESI